MKLTKALFLVPLLLCLPAQAAPPATSFATLSSAAQEQKAPLILRSPATPRANVFTLGGVGIAGKRPDQLLAYQAILRREDAPAVFQSLLTSPHAATRLYALTGLAKSAPTVFRKIAPRYQSRQEPVKMMSGCIAFERPFGEAVSALLAGDSPATFSRKPKSHRR